MRTKPLPERDLTKLFGVETVEHTVFETSRSFVADKIDKIPQTALAGVALVYWGCQNLPDLGRF